MSQDTFLNILAALGGAGGLLFGLAGFLSAVWRKRIAQREQAIIEEKLQLLSARLDASAHLHKAVLDRQLAASTATWEAVLKLASQVRFLRDHADDSASFDAQIEKCYQQHLLAHETLYANAPFYPETIRDLAFSCTHELELVYQGSDAALGKQNRIDLFRQLDHEQRPKVEAAVMALERAIREYLSGAASHT